MAYNVTRKYMYYDMEQQLMRIENEIRFFNVKLKSEMYPVLL